MCIYSPRIFDICREIDRKTGIDSAAGRPRATRFCSISPRKSRESIIFVSIAASTCTDSAFSFPLETDISLLVASCVRQRHSREVNEPAPKFPSTGQQRSSVDAFRRLPNVHLTCPQVQYGMKNGFVPIATPATGMMMMPPVLKREDEEDKERRSGQIPTRVVLTRFGKTSNRTEKKKKQQQQQQREEREEVDHLHPLHDTIERPETPFMNSPSAAADVLMSLCGQRRRTVCRCCARQTNRRGPNSNSETTCTDK